MIVRRLTPADVDAYQALRLRGLRESPQAFGSTYEEEVERPIASVAERLGGAGSTAVFGAYGEGRALLQALVDHARTLDGVDRLELGVEATNTPARALYHAFGFVTYGVHPDAYRAAGQSWDTELMTMSLR